MWLAIYNTDFTATTFAEFGFSFILLDTFVWTTTIYVWAWICFKLTLTISYSHKILYHFQFGSQPFQSYNCAFMKLVCSFFSRKNKKSDIYSCWLFLVSTKKTVKIVTNSNTTKECEIFYWNIQNKKKKLIFWIKWNHIILQQLIWNFVLCIQLRYVMFFWFFLVHLHNYIILTNIRFESVIFISFISFEFHIFSLILFSTMIIFNFLAW